MKRPKRNPLTDEEDDKLFRVLGLIITNIKLNKESKYPNELELRVSEMLAKKYKNSENLEEMYDEIQETVQFLLRLMKVIKG